MSYEVAIGKAWQDLGQILEGPKYSIRLLSDSYEIDLKDKSIISNSCNVFTKEYLTILILHYLIGFLKNGYKKSGEWISFKEIEGGESYYPAFRKSVLEFLLKKFANKPETLFSVLERFRAEKIDFGDAAVEIETFPDVFVRIILWKADVEFGPDATILFDKNITKIYSMEDVVVFSHFVTANL